MIGHFLFEHLQVNEKEHVLSQCKKECFEHGQIIHPANKVRKGLHLMLAGTAEVYIPGQTEKDDEVLEMVKEKEFLGLSQFHAFLSPSVSLEPSMLEVRAIDEVETLYIPFTVLDELMKHSIVRERMFHEVSIRLHDVYQSLATQVGHTRTRFQRPSYIQTVRDVMDTTPLLLEATTTIHEAVQKLRNRRSKALLVVNQQKLIGIVTEQDLIDRVLIQHTSADKPIGTIMTKNPIVTLPGNYTYEALSIMMTHGIKHLPVIENEIIIGLIHLSNVIQKEHLVHVNELLDTVTEEQLPKMKAHLYEVLGTLLHQEVPTHTLLHLMNTLYDKLIRQCVQMAEKLMGEPAPCPYVFYVMGSAGRREQFLLTDQDHFLVYEQDGHEDYFSRLGEEIVNLLEKAGYQRCRGNMMANNEQWRGSLSTWQSRLRDWVLHATNDRLLLAQNFFSFRFMMGSRELHDDFVTTIEQSLGRAKIFLYRLSQHEREHPVPTLEQPIRAIFRMNRKELDVKKQLLFPFHHSLQILSLMHNVVYGTPLEKLQVLHEKGVLSENFHKDLRASNESILQYYIKKRWMEYVANKDLTTTVELTSLSTREKEEWMINVRIIKELQSYMLSYY